MQKNSKCEKGVDPKAAPFGGKGRGGSMKSPSNKSRKVSGAKKGGY